MTAIELARKTKEEGVHVFRPRKDQPGQYDAKPYFTGRKSGWVILDSFSASAIVAVHEALNDENKTKFETVGARSIVKMASIAFKFVK